MRCYIPTESAHYNGPDERTVVEWSEYPIDYTQDLWDECGPDCLKNLRVVVASDAADRIAKEKAKLPQNYGGFATISRQRLVVYARDHGVALAHWEWVGESVEVEA